MGEITLEMKRGTALSTRRRGFLEKVSHKSRLTYPVIELADRNHGKQNHRSNPVR